MRREDLTDVAAFLAVAEERSFTRAAARLGLKPSTLSHTIRAFEERLGVRLLTRTTRSVAPTEAGERLLEAAGPRFEAVEAELAALSAQRGHITGMVRITTGTHGYETVLRPALKKLLPNHPDIRVEVVVEHRLTDIVAERFDAGLRLGERVERDMVAVRVGPEQRYVVVGAPAYFAGHTPPKTPQDLTVHRCITYRHGSSGALYAWEFEKDARDLAVKVEGPLVFNDALPALDAAVEGYALAYVPEDVAAPHLAAGRLVQVLDDWCQSFPGYHLYYPSRRQMAPALAVLVDALRWRER